MEINKIYNMDCLEGLKQLEDKSVDLIVTDPPYGMNFQSSHRKEKHIKIKNDNNLEWLDDLFFQLNRILKDNSLCYCFCSFHNIEKFMINIKKYINIKNILIWVKNNTSMGDLAGDYAPKYEFIIFISKGRKILNGKRDSNILKFSKTKNEHHPTEKPLNLIKYLISKSSKEGDIVLDCFMGSGTTAVACKELGRNYIGFELEKKYCDIAEARLKEVNNKKLKEWF